LPVRKAPDPHEAEVAVVCLQSHFIRFRGGRVLRIYVNIAPIEDKEKDKEEDQEGQK